MSLLSLLKIVYKTVMGYAVKSRGKKYYIRFVTYLNSSKTERTLADAERRVLGFHEYLSLEDARALAQRLNLEDRGTRINEKRNRHFVRAQDEANTYAIYLGVQEVEEFERDVLFADGPNKPKEMYWRTVQKCLCKLKLKPRDWHMKRSLFYSYFLEQEYSVSYVKKLLSVLNLWGSFQAHKYDTFFKPLGIPTGKHRFKLEEAFLTKRPGGMASAPLSFEMIERHRNNLKPEWFDWFWISCAFGLRPSEVDMLKQPSSAKTWLIEDARTLSGGTVKVLIINQIKINFAVGVHRSLKRIPIITGEQRLGVKMIARRLFERPSAPRHFKKYFGERVTLYGGRKGFTLWMRQLGQSRENYSQWLGHQSTDMTETNYEQRQVVGFTEIKKT